MKMCQYCGVENENKFRKCTSCGAPLKNLILPDEEDEEKIIFDNEDVDLIESIDEEEEEEESSSEWTTKDSWTVFGGVVFGMAFIALIIWLGLASPFSKKEPAIQSANPEQPVVIQSFYDVVHNNTSVVEFQCADRGVKKPNTVAEGFGCSNADGSSCLALWDNVCPHLVRQEDYKIMAHTQQCEDSPNPLTNCNGNNIVAYASPDYQDTEVVKYLPFGFPFKWHGCVTLHSWNDGIGGGFLFWTYVDDYGWIDAYQVEGGCGQKTAD